MTTVRAAERRQRRRGLSAWRTSTAREQHGGQGEDAHGGQPRRSLAGRTRSARLRRGRARRPPARARRLPSRSIAHGACPTPSSSATMPSWARARTATLVEQPIDQRPTVVRRRTPRAPARSSETSGSTGSPSATYGRFATTSSKVAPETGSSKSPRRQSIATSCEGGVLAREGEGVLGNVRRRDDCVGSRHGDRDRDRAAARADVEHARPGRLEDALERPLDEPLGLGLRHQHALVDGELEAAEAPAPDYASGSRRPRRRSRSRKHRPRRARAGVRDRGTGRGAGARGRGRAAVGVEAGGAHALSASHGPPGRRAAHRREHHPFSAS